MSHMLQPPIVLLREGTDTSQGRAQIISNINACQSIADVVRSTLGPRGMDKLIHQANGVTITNDGATVLKLLEVVHPAAKTLVDIAKSQDNEVGDGTTSVTLLASEFLKEAKAYVEEGLHSQVIIKAYRKAQQLAIAKLKELAVNLQTKNVEEKVTMLRRCAETSLNSKLLASYKSFFSEMIVKAIEHLDEDFGLSLLGVKKVTGGSVTDSFLVDGVAFKKTFSYAGFEQQPKSFKHPKILLLNLELELKSEKENAEVRIEDPEAYQSIVDAEWNIIYEKLDKIVATGAQVILSRLAIGDLATQYFADRGLFCAGRVADEDLQRVAKATGGIVQTTVNGVTEKVLGTCGYFEEKQVGGERFNIFIDCPQSRTSTFVLRGGAEQYLDEAERSLHDAIMIVRRANKSTTVVGGGGAIEMELSRYLREYSRSISGKQQLIINSYARALETIPRSLADNAGFDSTDILNKLRHKHATGKDGRWYGVDMVSEGICDTIESFVWEPTVVKLNAIASATEAACMILSVDETVRNPQSQQAQAAPGGGRGRGMPPGMGRGRGLRAMRGRGGK
eukprot:GILJ01003787.1.p1 GENE.GILJ01003787.1~~GILJ01003787.1.p1  ORF type:complete len:564 (-),score=110.26 GILJ01003787.1:128-1819(-)